MQWLSHGIYTHITSSLYLIDRLTLIALYLRIHRKWCHLVGKALMPHDRSTSIYGADHNIISIVDTRFTHDYTYIYQCLFHTTNVLVHKIYLPLYLQPADRTLFLVLHPYELYVVILRLSVWLLTIRVFLHLAPCGQNVGFSIISSILSLWACTTNMALYCMQVYQLHQYFSCMIHIILFSKMIL